MKIGQIGARQFVHDPPTFLNRHQGRSGAELLNDQYSAKGTAKRSHEHIVKNDAADIIKTAKDIARIQRETDYIKDTHQVPPTWKLNII